MRTFDDLMNSEENHIRLKMKPGDMVTVKNTRVMHGRSGLRNTFFCWELMGTIVVTNGLQGKSIINVAGLS